MTFTIWTDKDGNKLTPKEFMARFKEGVTKITPLQNTKVTLVGQGIVLAGIILGIIINLVYSLWWLLIILGGSLLITTMSTLATYQKYILLKNIDFIYSHDDIQKVIEEKTEAFETEINK